MYNTGSDPLFFHKIYAGARFRSGKALSLYSNALTLEALTVHPMVHIICRCSVLYNTVHSALPFSIQ